ncbi:MAG: hypothetical protein ACTHNS_04105 [Marmoricola sp.]
MSQDQPEVPGDVPDTAAENEVGAIDPGQTTAMRDTADEVAQEVLESDPNGNGPDGLAGGMGVSSERRGEPMGSSVSSTHGTQSVTAEAPVDPDEESSGAADEDNPAALPPHPFDPGTATPHSHG